jgi:TolA-binding protein
MKFKLLVVFLILLIDVTSLANEELLKNAKENLKNKNYEAAHTQFTQLLNYDTYRSKAFFGIGHVLVMQDNIQEAKEQFAFGLNANTTYGPNHSASYLNFQIGELFFKHKNLDEALVYFKRSKLLYNPNNKQDKDPEDYVKQITLLKYSKI